MTTLLLSSIHFDDSERQRSALVGVDELAASIASIGLIQPPVVTRDGRLIAGRRRIAAMTQLGWLQTPVIYSDEVDPARLQLMELEENVKRVDLPWQDRVAATVRYHQLKKAENPEQQLVETAAQLALDVRTVSEIMQIDRAMREAPDLNIAAAENYSTARGLAARFEERKKGNAVASLLGLEGPADEDGEESPDAGTGQADFEGNSSTGTTTSVLRSEGASILHADFTEWVTTTQLKFNFLHCDFPYGVSTGDKTSGQSASKRLGTYDDSADVYWNLIDVLLTHQDRIVDEQAHLMFWHSMKYHRETVDVLTNAGWKVDPFPLIWHKTDNSGIIPDPERGGRRTYEACLFASRGDRKIVRPVAMSYGAPSPKDLHTHEKHGEMLRHFFRMIVDSSTVMLDPTCGSGSAVKAARDSGAAFALGLEKDAEFAQRAIGSL